MWNTEPDADALLEDRLSRGWTPTPTATVDGERILGHAACRFGHPAAGSASGG